MAVEPVERTWSAEQAGESERYRWYHKLGAVLFSFFCFEIGVFLFCFPWLEIWNQNYFAGLSAGWADLWENAYFRGAVSGLGLVNIGISLLEALSLRRFSRRAS